MCWNELNFDVTSNSYVYNAYKQKKFAFVSDYARLKVLYDVGGFYFDTDVELFRSIDMYKDCNFISGIAFFAEFEDHKHLLNEDLLPKQSNILVPCLGIMSAVMGVQPNNQLIGKVLEFYDNLREGNEYFNGIVLDQIMAIKAIEFGFIFKNIQQCLANHIVLLSSSDFCSSEDQYNSESFLLHHCAQSWQNKTKIQRLHLFLDKYYLLKTYKKAMKFKRKLLNFHTKK